MFWLLMALNILNLSVDPPDADPSAPEDLSINDMESIAEIILEEVLSYDNAFAEADEQDQPDGQNLDIKKISLYFDSYDLKTLWNDGSIAIVNVFNLKEPFCPKRYLEVLNPPPEA